MDKPENTKINWRKWAIQNFFSLAAIGVAIVNLYLAYRLSPIISDLKDFGNRVSAVEGKVTKHETDSTNLINAINGSLEEIKKSVSGSQWDSLNSRLSRIEGELRTKK